MLARTFLCAILLSTLANAADDTDMKETMILNELTRTHEAAALPALAARESESKAALRSENGTRVDNGTRQGPLGTAILNAIGLGSSSPLSSLSSSLTALSVNPGSNYVNEVQTAIQDALDKGNFSQGQLPTAASSGDVDYDGGKGGLSDAYGPPKKTYGPPQQVYAPPSPTYAPPAATYAPPAPTYAPPPPPPPTYSPPPPSTYAPPPPSTYAPPPPSTYAPPPPSTFAPPPPPPTYAPPPPPPTYAPPPPPPTYAPPPPPPATYTPPPAPPASYAPPPAPYAPPPPRIVFKPVLIPVLLSSYTTPRPQTPPAVYAPPPPTAPAYGRHT